MLSEAVAVVAAAALTALCLAAVEVVLFSLLG